ncbi:MAG: hypothetical protein K0R17_1021 [Rariglobus sp.]|jgi:hypothetical protein|nr:hypothetical protein [Rariglobus sp.]
MAKTRNSFGILFLTIGPPGLVKVINQILAALDALRVQRSLDIDPLVTVEGTLLTIRNPATGGGRVRTTTTYPLDLSLTDAGATFTGVFRPGTLNGKLPSNYNALPGIAKTGVVFVVLTGTMNNGQPTSCVFTTAASAPAGYPVQIDLPPNTLPILTHVIADGIVFRVIGPTSITATVVESFRTAKTTTGPGQRTFNSYYTYEVDSG